MKQKEVERLIRAYLPERRVVTRIDDTVYFLNLPSKSFNGAKTIKFRKIKMWRCFGLRVGFGMWLERMGKRIADGAVKRGSDNGTDTQE